MQLLFCIPIVAGGLLAPVAGNLPVGPAAQTHSQLPVRANELDTHSSSALGQLRAGRLALPSRIESMERSELVSASAKAQALGAMRAGTNGPSDNQWKWIGVGAAVVLLIVLL